MRWIPLVMFIALAACTEPHDGVAIELSHAAGDCETCHKTDTDPQARLPHPNRVFPIVNPNPYNVITKHDGIACQDCHHFNRGAGLEGGHSDCTNICHLRGDIDATHTSRSGYMWDPMNHDFCVSCHPQGFAMSLPPL